MRGQPDGTVGDIQVIRSLDSTFGLDQEAIKAATQWRFAPGTRLGEPVPVLITIELDVHAALRQQVGSGTALRQNKRPGSDCSAGPFSSTSNSKF